MDKLKGRDIIEKIKAGYSLPSLSAVALRLVEIASNEYVSLSEMADLIEKDPGLTVRLVTIANSAFFRSTDPVSTVEQSVMRVGVNHLRIMALSLSLRDTFPMGKLGPMDYEKFWRSSLYQALIAKSFAQRLQTCSPEEAFVAGLVLEIGLLIFVDTFLKGHVIEKNLDLHPLEKLLEWEAMHYRTDHREIGAAALSYWKFPSVIIECQHVHNIETRDEQIPPLDLICEMAREFSALICEESMEWIPLFSRAEAMYGINQGLLTDILVATFDEVQEVADGLKVNMNKEKDLIALIEKANLSLGGLSEKMLKLQETALKHGLPSFESLGDLEEKSAVRDTLQAVAHEIRNPLLAVSGFAKKLSTALDPASDGWKYVQVIVEESRRLESALANMTCSNKC